jgi:hypothetical protein
MEASYNFICVPLDTRDPAGARDDFGLRIVTEIRFQGGVLHEPATINDALGRHPLLTQPQGQPIKVLIWDFDSWRANGRAMNPNVALKATIKYSGGVPVDSLLSNLKNYLGTSKQAIRTANLGHSSRQETLTNEHFVDVNKAADDLRRITHTLKVSALRSIAAANSSGNINASLSPQSAIKQDLTNTSFKLTKWLDSAIHSSLSSLFRDDISDENWDQHLHALTDTPSKLQDVVDAARKVSDRMRVDTPPSCPPEQTQYLQAVGANGNVEQVDPADPNAAIHAAMKNSLMAESCGFVTRWLVTSPQPIFEKRDYVVQLDIASISYDSSKIEVQSATPTAFRQLGHTHPLSYVDIGNPETQNCLLALLNDKLGPRYRASCVNAETGLVKQTILQGRNSLANPAASGEDNFGCFNSSLDERPPQVLKDHQHGSPEPETSGVVFSAPPEDLIAPSGLRFPTEAERRTAMPCLFLEDLWTGYRLDLKSEGSKEFSSTHLQVQEITFKQSGVSVSGRMEDHIEREQLDDPSVKHSSTDLTTYNGLSSGQMKDYQTFLGVGGASGAANSAQIFVARTVSYDMGERLVFQRLYDYRLRVVMLGGISCECSDMELAAPRFQGPYQQRFPFFRSRAFRAGEIVGSLTDQPQANSKEGRTIYLTSEHSKARLTLVPSPIDLDTSRYFGLAFVRRDDLQDLQGRKYVADLGKFFERVPPTELNYFYDPDVHGVIVRVTMLNGDEQSEPENVVFTDGTYCRLVKHLELQPVTETYGEEGNWKEFKPIVISLHASSDERPHIVKKGWWQGCRHIEIGVPPAAELHLSLLPLFDINLLTKTSSFIASSADLTNGVATVTGAEAFVVPAVSEEVVKVVHAVDRPRVTPSLYCTDPKLMSSTPTGNAICTANRELDAQFVTFAGRVELDAASTKEIRLEATWTDITDSPAQDKYLLQSAKATSLARSVVFREFDPLTPSPANFYSLFLSSGAEQPSSRLTAYQVQQSQYGFSDQFSLQCAENKVFFGRAVPDGPCGEPKSNRFDVKDLRRKLAQVEATALVRYADMLGPKGKSVEVRSNAVVIDAPSTVKLSAPKISHVVPLRRADQTGTPESGMKRFTYGIRIYVQKPYFESGFGERLAIGCSASEETTSNRTELQKHVTQWGEDPIERAGLDSSLRMPRTSDFGSPEGGSELDEVLYPPNVRGGNARVIYRSNLEIGTSGGSNVLKRTLSVTSYALQYDDVQRLWFADITTQENFFGWCGLALYRHQPGALPERELSDQSTWAYAAILYGEPVAWTEREQHLHITIGPVFDPYVTFELDSVRYRDGVSQNLTGLSRESQVLKSYAVDNARYFEAIVPSQKFTWNLLKKRFGHALASSSLRQ